MAEIREGFALNRELGIPPSVAIYEPTWLNHTLSFDRAEWLPHGAMIKLYFDEVGRPVTSLSHAASVLGLPARERIDGP